MYDFPQELKTSLSTKLFKASPGGRFTPVHRHVAEFLAGRHLCWIICGGPDQAQRYRAHGSGPPPPPARRVIALLIGVDGMVVSELRGLSAWLASHCVETRRALISGDPTGVGLYGDIQRFSLEEKRELLSALKHHVSRLESIYHAAPAFSALATPDMESALREVLEDTNSAKIHEVFVDFVLCILGFGDQLPGLSDVLFKIVLDKNRSPWVNRSALIAFMHNCPESYKTDKLRFLLGEIEAGRVPDTENEMLGTILSQLYPKWIPPSSIWDYLRESARHIGGGMYDCFWRHDLLARSSGDQMAELLDSLVHRLPDLYIAIESRQAGDFVMELLLRGLVTHGDTVCIERLYAWLGIGSADFGHRLRELGSIRSEIRAWLEQRPAVCEAIILEGVKRCSDLHDFLFDVPERLYNVALPVDHGLRGLYQSGGTEGLEAHKLSDKQSFTVDGQFVDREKELSIRHRKAIEQRRRREKNRLDHIRASAGALRENRAKPALLHDLARVYFGPFFNFNGVEGPRAIRKNLRGDPSLSEAVLAGLRATADREDTPNVDGILQHYEAGKRYFIGLPYVAGLAERERTAPEDAALWSEDQAQQALAFYFTENHRDYLPAWFQRLLAVRSRTVADVYIRYVLSGFKRNADSVQEIHQLSSNPDYGEVARIASWSLLQVFPTRCRTAQVETLEHLLTAALRCADRASLRRLVDRKLSRTSMNVAQRARWLATGLIVSPGKYNDCVDRFVGIGRGRVSRIYDLMSLLHSDAFEGPIHLGSAELGLLIRLAGRDVEPDAMNRSYFVHKMIERLAADPNREAADVLETLLADRTQSAWHDELEAGLHTHRKILRDGSYRPLDIEQISQTLRGGMPANAGDLAALVTDRLAELATRIRCANTDDWKQYWNIGPYGKPLEPRPENFCRDTLLSDLRACLPEGVDAQPEGQYTNDRRADMRIACANFQVPVEVKKNSHRELWSAMRKQLITHYIRDPDTGGYGIFLVFWFGREKTQPPPSGERPDHAQALQERLEATLSREEARKISVCVIDVSQISHRR